MLYLKLFHGRKNANESLDDWGEDGPVFGPYRYIHTTYAHHIKMGTNPDCVDDLYAVEDMIYYDGMYYGDWSIFTDDVMAKEDSSIIQKYDREKAELPKQPSSNCHRCNAVKFVVYVKSGMCQQVITNLSDDSWEYAVVDYDSNPELPEDYCPFSKAEMGKLHLLLLKGGDADGSSFQ